MSLKSFLSKFFLGREVLTKINSPINGEIRVCEDLFGRREMLVGKIPQSGGLVSKLWKEGLRLIKKEEGKKQKPKKNKECLILGLGAGTLAKQMAQEFGGSRIVGIEKDPQVIRLGRKYFALGEIPNLKIVIDDAFENLKKQKTKFDLIIVDLYFGQEFPPEAESNKFFKDILKLIGPDGLVVFNRLYFNQEQRDQADEFVRQVAEFFPWVKTKRLVTNLLILASIEAKNKV